MALSDRQGVPNSATWRGGGASGSRHRLVERKREIEPVSFFWSFLFGTTQPDVSVTKVQKFYKIITGHDAAYSSIQQWITTELKRLLMEIFAHISTEIGRTESPLGGRLDRFCDVRRPSLKDVLVRLLHRFTTPVVRLLGEDTEIDLGLNTYV